MSDNNKNISVNDAENNNSSNLDALLMDLEDKESGNSTVDETADFHELMAEYRDMISKLQGSGKKAEDNRTADPQEEYLKPRANAKKQDDKAIPIEKKSDWNEDITLAPGEYEELDDGSGMQENIPAEEPVPDFNLGESNEERDDKFQLSINFEGEHKSAVNEEHHQEKKYDPDNPRIIDWVFDIAEMFVFVLAAVIILTSFVFKHAEVRGDSMLNTYDNGDHLIVSNLFYTPERGDVIVFEDYSKTLQYRKPVIKRVIALEGDTVELSLSEDKKSLVVKVNGETIEDEHACYDHYEPNGLIINPGETMIVKVEAGQVFVMGDNRYNSTDSRSVGTINVDSILGKALFRFYPFNKFGAVD